MFLNLVEPVTNKVRLSGYKGVYLQKSISSFESEVTALDLAVDFVKAALRLLRERKDRRKRKILFTDI